jgi:amino acid transporter
MVVLLMAFANFDRLVKIEYKKYKEEWIKDSKPRGFFWKPSEITWFASSLAMQRLSMKWLFKTPVWVTNDLEAKEYLRKLRLYVLIFNVGIIVWAVISMIINERNM